MPTTVDGRSSTRERSPSEPIGTSDHAGATRTHLAIEGRLALISRSKRASGRWSRARSHDEFSRELAALVPQAASRPGRGRAIGARPMAQAHAAFRHALADERRPRLGEVTGQALAQAGYFGGSTPRCFRPVIDLVPGVLLRGASVPHHHVLMKVLEPCVDDHRMYGVDVELGTQRPCRVSNGAADRCRLLICQRVDVGRVAVCFDKKMSQREGSGPVDKVFDPNQVVAPHHGSDQVPFAAMPCADGALRASHVQRLRRPEVVDAHPCR
jgi:hypothetical protein